MAHIFNFNELRLRMFQSWLGVRLEHGSWTNEQSNNTLLREDIIGEGERVLFCSTDRKDCCDNESDIHGNWFLPNGSKVLATKNTHFETAYVTRGNQTVGLNRVNNSSSLELPSGVYHCEMMDKNNITHYLYIGIYHENEGKLLLYTYLFSFC